MSDRTVARANRARIERQRKDDDIYAAIANHRDLNYDELGEAAAQMTAHLADPDPHPQYATDAAMTTALALKAPLASPALTGTPTAPTPAAGTNTTQIATMAALQTAIANLVASSPATLDTLNELATALGNDPNFATTITAALSGKQPLDATLTALAAANWALNAMPVGTGADALSQLALAANQFFARSSAGNIAAKAITDFGLSLVDDATAAAARVTLGASEGLYTPVGTTVANCTAVSSPDSCMWTQQGELVTVYGNLSVTVTAAALTQFSITLPIASNLQSASNDDCAGTGTAGSGASQPSCFVRSDTVNDRAFFQFTASAGGVTPLRFTFRYRVRA